MRKQFNPAVHHRRSIRLRGYDYKREGLYFITVCTKKRECFFGMIKNNKTFLNNTGKIANAYWQAIPQHFPQVILHEHVVMPNHVHGIIELNVRAYNNPSVGVRHEPSVGTRHEPSVGTRHEPSVGTRHVVSLQPQQPTQPSQYAPRTRCVMSQRQNAFSKPIAGSISVIIQQYKSSVKRWCNKNGVENFHWQSRYHDHIIRNERSFRAISNYIATNPEKWQDDTFHF